MTEIRDRFNSIRFAYTQNIQMPPNGLNTDWCLKGNGVWVLHQFWLDSDLIDSVIWFTSSLLDGCLHLCFRYSTIVFLFCVVSGVVLECVNGVFLWQVDSVWFWCWTCVYITIVCENIQHGLCGRDGGWWQSLIFLQEPLYDLGPIKNLIYNVSKNVVLGMHARIWVILYFIHLGYEIYFNKY